MDFLLDFVHFLIIFGWLSTNKNFLNVLVNHRFKIIFAKDWNDVTGVDIAWILFHESLHGFLIHCVFDWVKSLTFKMRLFFYGDIIDDMNLWVNLISCDSAFIQVGAVNWWTISVEMMIEFLSIFGIDQWNTLVDKLWKSCETVLRSVC